MQSSGFVSVGAVVIAKDAAMDRICKEHSVSAQGLLNGSPVPSSQHSRRRVWLGMAIVGGALAVALIGCLIVVLAVVRPSQRRTHRLEMTIDTTPRNALMAEQLRAESAHHHLDIVLTKKEYGTLAALDEVDSPNAIKCAMVVGGVTNRDYPHVRTVTSLAKEHLHLLVKGELAEKGISGLHGKRIALGPSTTASHHVSHDALSFAGLVSTKDNKDGGYDIDPITPQESLHELTRIEALDEPARAEAIRALPDAFMFLSPLPSPLARQLVTGFGYQLVPMPFAEAYGLDRLNEPSDEGVRIDRSVLTSGAIPAYTYGFDRATPAKECPTICAPVILVAEDDADPEAISLLLETIYESPLTNAIHPPALDEQLHSFPPHPAAQRYLHRKDPLLTPELMSRLGAVLTGIGAFLSGAIGIYGYLRLRNLKRFEAYYREIAHIEMIARGFEEDPAAPIDVSSLQAYLENRLSTLKCKVLEDFAAGGLRGEGLMAGIIALINDTRESLAGLVTAPIGNRQSQAREKPQGMEQAKDTTDSLQSGQRAAPVV
jgi:TRAP-type uncharacterized transport system substrate-binding protein